MTRIEFLRKKISDYFNKRKKMQKLKMQKLIIIIKSFEKELKKKNEQIKQSKSLIQRKDIHIQELESLIHRLVKKCSEINKK